MRVSPVSFKSVVFFSTRNNETNEEEVKRAKSQIVNKKYERVDNDHGKLYSTYNIKLFPNTLYDFSDPTKTDYENYKQNKTLNFVLPKTDNTTMMKDNNRIEEVSRRLDTGVYCHRFYNGTWFETQPGNRWRFLITKKQKQELYHNSQIEPSLLTNSMVVAPNPKNPDRKIKKQIFIFTSSYEAENAVIRELNKEDSGFEVVYSEKEIQTPVDDFPVAP